MARTTAAAPRATPLHAQHLALGGRMTSFAGWALPIAYDALAAEHRAVRTAAGLFDVSHMGEIEIAGADALRAVQRVTANDAGRIAPGQAHYSALTTPQGTVVDDLVVYRLAPDHFLLVVNAVNTARDVAWIRERTADAGDVAVVDASRRYALLALQGPAAAAVLSPLAGDGIVDLPRYGFITGEVAGVRAVIARTGYTGEDGFELFVAPASAGAVWEALLDAGRPAGLRPAGLGARDTLRLEAGMRLYGQDIDETTTLLEAGLGWIVGWDKAPFIGQAALEAQRRAGVPRRLIGFEMIERGIARPGHPVHAGADRVGDVTSGTLTPFLDTAIGLAYVPTPLAAPGTELEIGIRGQRRRARVVRLPFYRRPR